MSLKDKEKWNAKYGSGTRQAEREPRDRLLEKLFEEDRQAELACPDVLLDQSREYAWGLDHAC